MDWFNINSLKFNQGEFQIMVLIANKNDSFKLNVVGKVIPSTSEVKLLGITNDNELIKKNKTLMNSVGNHFISFMLSKE